MALDLRENWFRNLAELRYATTPKRIRADLDGETVLDTRDALLVWEPRRVVPWYAVPEADLHLATTEHEPARRPASPGLSSVRSTRGTPRPGSRCTPTASARSRFRPDDPALGGRVIVTWAPFAWREEDEPVISHPHDPFARIDVLRSDRHVRVTVGDTVLAESDRPVALIETSLPVRWYLPPDDVRMDLLTPSRDPHPVRLQGHGVVPQRRRRPRRRLVLPRPAPRRAAGQGPALLLARRDRRGRRRAGADGDAGRVTPDRSWSSRVRRCQCREAPVAATGGRSLSAGSTVRSVSGSKPFAIAQSTAWVRRSTPIFR